MGRGGSRSAPAAGFGLLATGVGPAVGPLWPPPCAAGGPGHLRSGIGGQRPGAQHGPAGRVACAARRSHGRGGDVRAPSCATCTPRWPVRVPCPKALTPGWALWPACAPRGWPAGTVAGLAPPLLALTVYATATLALVALRMPKPFPTKPQAPSPARCCAPGAWCWATQLLGLHCSPPPYGGLFLPRPRRSCSSELLQLAHRYGWVMLSTSVAYFCGTFVCRYLLTAGAAPLVGHCRGLEPGWWHGPGLVALAGSQNQWPCCRLPVHGGARRSPALRVKQARWHHFRKRLAWHRP